MVPVAIVDWSHEAAAKLGLLLSSADTEFRIFQNPSDYFADPMFPEAHVAVISIQQEEFTGLDVLAYAVRKSSAQAVFAIIETPDTASTVAAIKAGARDVLERPVPSQPILRAVAGASLASPIENAPLQAALTKREQDVLRRLTSGMSNKAIAEQLGVSVRTVESHRARIYTKLGVNSQTELIRKIEV